MSTMSRLTSLASLVIAIGAAPQLAAQTQALTFVSSGSVGNNNDQNVGWSFNVLTGINVTGLEWFDTNGDGLSQSHQVGIWNSVGTLLASAIIPSGTAATLTGGFRFVPINAVFLAAAGGYIVGGLNFANSTDRIESNVTSQTTVPEIQYVDATFSGLTSTFGRPDQFSSATTGFYGPSFTVSPVTSVPEPGTFVLMATGVGGLIVLRRRRSA